MVWSGRLDGGKAGEYVVDDLFLCFHEVTLALASMSARMTGADTTHQVETTSRLAQWKINGPSTYRKSDPFKIGLWNWYLSVERSRQVFIRLYPESSTLTRDRPPIASFIIRVVCSAGDRKTLVHPGVCDKQLKSNEDFVWAIDTVIAGKFLVDVEFIDLKTVLSAGSEPSSIWTFNHITKASISTALTALQQMLAEGIHTDITINTTDGSIAAHRAILATRSPVFCGMFSHSLQEKALSTFHIPDISTEACRALLNYLYGHVEVEEFISHQLALLRAANKYDVADLKEACEESLVEDIDANNVLERLQCGHLYRLSLLKESCLKYLVMFGKIHEIREEFNAFAQFADRNLIVDIFQEIFSTWKGF